MLLDAWGENIIKVEFLSGFLCTALAGRFALSWEKRQHDSFVSNLKRFSLVNSVVWMVVAMRINFQRRRFFVISSIYFSVLDFESSPLAPSIRDNSKRYTKRLRASSKEKAWILEREEKATRPF